MTDLNVPAIASAAFLGFLALAALLFCLPPVYRFLGDLFCCPWRVPFTRKRRRNGDEEVDKEDLPYYTRRLNSPVDDVGFTSTSDNNMAARGTREHETTGEPLGDHQRRITYTDDGQQMDGFDYGGSIHDSEPPFPQSHSRDWWARSHTDEYREYTEQAPHRYHVSDYYSDGDNYGYDKEIFSDPDVQRPRPSYSPSEMMSHQYAADYFPRVENEYYDQYRRQ